MNLRNLFKLGLGLLLFMLVINGCKKVDQEELDDSSIQTYLSDNGLVATKHNSGLYYIISDSGFGGNPDINTTVSVYYRGTLLDGTEFDKTLAPSPALVYPLSALIPGWQIGIPLFQKGGKGKLFIPSALGYGAKATGNIPKNSVLIFDIELVDFQ